MLGGLCSSPLVPVPLPSLELCLVTAGKESAPWRFIFRINLPIHGPLFCHLILEGFFFFGQIPQPESFFWHFDCNCNLLGKLGLIGFLLRLVIPP